ncbi:MAG TPA: hypothetical protein PK740_04375 [Bacteroidales bacterium]|nr:hypothetical protein [Bacteroidales bacterium]
MKKYILASLFVVFCIMNNGCTKFEPAIVNMSVTPIVYPNTCLIDCKADVTNNGGCKYFNEMGFCFSLKPNPTYKGEDVITVISMEDVESTNFTLNYPAPLLDTIYYVRAYVCTNAGTGYSEVATISTYQPVAPAK